MNRNFKLREQDYKAIQGMTEKEAGQFIKGLCGYAFDGVPMETKDAKIASAYAYAKVALAGKRAGLSWRNESAGRRKPRRSFRPQEAMTMQWRSF